MNNNPIDQYRHQFLDFLEKDFNDSTYHQKVVQLVQNAEKQSLLLRNSSQQVDTRLLIDLDHLRQFDAQLASDLLRGQEKCAIVHMGFESGLRDVVQREYGHLIFTDQTTMAMSDQTAVPLLNLDQFHVGFQGHFGSHVVSPRQLLSHFLNSMICVEGIITKINSSVPELIQSVHYCPANAKFHRRTYRTETSVLGLATTMAFPTRDDEGHPLETEHGLCRYKDRQTLFLQEMPERAPAGQLPRSVEIDLEDDLVDVIKPGDRVRIAGLYKPVTKRSLGGSHSGTMNTTIGANSVTKLDHQIQMPSASDIKEIRRVSHQEDVFEVLSQSLAPSIFGHEQIKKALLLQLLGGVEKNLEHGTHLRGDINILLVGDPGTAKSQLLRYMLNLNPLSISTSGRSSTGVGLTAAVVADPQTGERTLQAGAMVLADRGLVCVDEFDKMVDEDRTAMHEVMEQQTVTIQKAGIHTTLNARASVLAAANPIYGHYDPRKSVQYNVNLPDSLLSRFDLVFVLVDTKDQFRDRDIATHVLKMHQFNAGKQSAHGRLNAEEDLKPNEIGAIAIDQGAQDTRRNEEQTLSTTTVFGQKRYTLDFLKKYVAYAKTRKPKMQTEAMELIQEKYVYLRSGASRQKTLPITARALETLIRLSTAHAKCRLSKEVTTDDVEGAFQVMEYAIYFGAQDLRKKPLVDNIPDGATTVHDDETTVQNGDDAHPDDDHNDLPEPNVEHAEQLNRSPHSANGAPEEDEQNGEDDETDGSSRKRKRSVDDNEEKATKKSKSGPDSDSILNIVKFALGELIQAGKTVDGFLEIDTLLDECKPFKSSLKKEDLTKLCVDGTLGDQYWYDDDTEKLYLNSL